MALRKLDTYLVHLHTPLSGPKPHMQKVLNKYSLCWTRRQRPWELRNYALRASSPASSTRDKCYKGHVGFKIVFWAERPQGSVDLAVLTWDPWIGFKRPTNPWHCVKIPGGYAHAFQGEGKAVVIAPAKLRPSEMKWLLPSGKWWPVGRVGPAHRPPLLISILGSSPSDRWPTVWHCLYQWSQNIAFLQLRRMVRWLYSFIGFCFLQTTIFFNG